MKYILSSFFLFFFLFCATFTVHSQNLPFGQDPKVHQEIKTFMAFMQQLNEEAKKQKPEDAIFAKNMGKYNLFSPVYLMQTNASPLSGTNGYSDWKTLPFGKARLISCTSGTKGETSVFTAFQIMLDPQFILSKPLFSNLSPNETDVKFLYPLHYPLPTGKTKTDKYAGFLIFPMIADVPRTDEPFTLAVETTLTACQETGCQTLTTPFALTLPHTESYPTGICPLMVEALQTVPLPNKETVKARAVQDQDGTIGLALTFEKPTSLVSIQIDNDWTFEELGKDIRSKEATLTLRPTTPLTSGEKLNLKVITSYGFYDVPTILSEGKIHTIAPSMPWQTFIFGGIGLFFFTPFFGLFLLQKPRTQKSLHKGVKEILLCLFIMTILTGLLWQVDALIPLDFIQTSWFFVFLSFFLLCYLSLHPKVNLAAGLALFWFIPKPYLTAAFTPVIQENAYPFLIVCWWGLTIALPFLWMYKNPQAAFTLFNFFKAAQKPLHHFVRIPFLILLCWLIIGAGVNALVNKNIPFYTQESVTDAIESDKMVFVSIENPVCFSCAWNKAVILKTGYARPFVRSKKLVQMWLPLSSEMGQTLKMQHGQPTPPLNLLYGHKNKDGLILPTTLEYFKLKEHFGAVRPLY